MAEKKTFKALQVVEFGLPKVVELEIPIPSKNQLLIKVAFTPINPSSLMIIKGFYPAGLTPPFIMVGEASGTVAEVGPELTVPYKVGDRVSIFGATWAEYALISSESAIPILPENTLEEASAHFVNPATVISMLNEVKKGGHKAVIHTAGSSALGRMLIKTLKEAGLKSINIVRRDDYTQELLDIGADYVLNSQAPDFEQSLKKISAEISATVCFEAVGGELTTKVLKAMPNGSHVLCYGALQSGDVPNIPISELLFSGKTLGGFWLSKISQSLDVKGRQELALACQKGLKTTLRSDVAQKFKLEEFKEAFEFYEKFSSKGKVLFAP